jgi:AcrR family transcriptional regulator
MPAPDPEIASASPRRGRPRSFSREKALEQAMELFWERGYEGATLTDFQKVMGGITAPSFYAAFGSKEQLFREVVGLYNHTQGRAVVKALNEGATARASMEGLLRAAAAAASQRGRPRGCLVILAGIHCMPDNSAIEDFLREQRLARHKMIRKRLERAIAAHDLPRSADLNAITSFYVTILDGLALQAKDGASRKALSLVVDAAMEAWDALTHS